MASAAALDLTRPRDPSAFEDEAGPFLCLREAENNLILGLTSNLRSGRRYGEQPPFLMVAREGERVVGAAMRTPPFNLIFAAGTRVDALDAILDAVARDSTDVSGVLGPRDLTKRAVERWTERTGIQARITMRERIYSLARVIPPPRPVAGRMRRAEPRDLDVLAPWFYAFVEEAQPHLERSLDVARRNADGWIASGGLRVWEDGGVVSMAGASGPTPHGIRVGAVYTPPDRRRRGYASALVAALSQEQLDAGRTFCFLYTDLANPTSNKIYQGVGYEPVADVDEYAFIRT